MASRRRLLTLALAVLAACDGSSETDGGARADGGDPADASQPDAGPHDAGPPSVATSPAPPDLGACTDGWRAAEVDGIAYCDPWPAAGILACTGAEAHFPGETACRSPGAACEGEFASELPASGVLYVRPLGTATGIGTLADPFGTIAQALAAASPGTTIALARGRFEVVQVDLPSDVRLVGACPEQTVLASASLSADFGVVSVFASERGVVEGLRIEGERPGVFVGAGGSVTVRGVAIDGAEGWGLIADEGGSLVAEDVVVRNIRRYDDFDLGEGVYVRRGGQLTLTRGVIERTVQHGAYVEDAGSRLELTDVAVRDVAAGPMGYRGVGVLATDFATARLTRVAIDRVSEAGVATLLDAEITAERVVARDVAQGGFTDFGAGFLARAGGRIDATRVLVERAQHAGAIVLETDSELSLTDALVRDTQLAARPEPDRWGMGIVAQTGGTLALTRAASIGNRFLGIFGVEGGTLTLTDVTVRDTRAVEATEIYGRGLELQEGAIATLRRASFEGNRDVAISLTDADSGLDAEDVLVGDTLATGAGEFGYGLQVVDGASVTLTRGTFRGLRGAGILVARAALTADTIEIAGGRLLDCATDGRCGTRGAAYDVVVLGGGAATVTAFRFEGAPTAALQLAETGEADLSDGLIADSPIGFNVQTPGFDDARLRTGVTFLSVGTELDRSALPILSIPPFGI